MSPVYNNTITLSNTVGELNKTVTVSSTNPEVTGDDLLQLAKRALEHNEVTGVEGVSIEINIAGPQEESPFVGFTSGPVKVTVVDTRIERENRERDEAMKFSHELEHRTSQMFESALEWLLCKVACVTKTDEGWAHVQKVASHEIGKGWAHVQMLQEHIERLEKNHVEGQELIETYRQQINDLQQLMGERAEVYSNNIRSMERELKEKTDANLEFECKLRQYRDCLDRMRGI